MFTPAYRAYILGVLFVSYIFNFMDRTILAVVMPMLKSELKLMDWEIGLVTGRGLFGDLCRQRVAPGAARRPDRSRAHPVHIDRRLGAATVLCGFAGSFSQLFLARIGVGLGEAGSSPCSASLISDLYGPRRRANRIRNLQCRSCIRNLGRAADRGLCGACLWLAPRLRHRRSARSSRCRRHAADGQGAAARTVRRKSRHHSRQRSGSREKSFFAAPSIATTSSAPLCPLSSP